MSLLKDTMSIFKKKELTFLESCKESEGVYSFLFEKNNASWKAGQYGLFTIAHKKIKNPTKPFTVSSAPAEEVVKLTTIINEDPSEFKQALLELKQGMKIKMGGPVGDFFPADERPTLMIAGGIGITPYRSILKQMKEEQISRKQTKLLYLDSNKPHIFKEELNELAQISKVELVYIDSRDVLHKEIDKFADVHLNNGNYFVAGPESMVKTIVGHLQKKKISKRNIKKDGFYGY